MAGGGGGVASGSRKPYKKPAWEKWASHVLGTGLGTAAARAVSPAGILQVAVKNNP